MGETEHKVNYQLDNSHFIKTTKKVTAHSRPDKSQNLKAIYIGTGQIFIQKIPCRPAGGCPSNIYFIV